MSASSLRRSAMTSMARRQLSTLLVAEHDGTNVSEATLAAVTAAQALGPVELLVGGEGSKAAAESAASITGVSSVTYVEGASLSKGLAEEWTPVIMAAQAASGHTHVVAAASAFSKGVFPRVAALLDVAQLSDVLEVKDENTFVRPMYAGNALSTVESADPVKVFTVRPTVFDKAARTGGSAEVKEMAAPGAVGKSIWVSGEVKKSDRPELATAKVVVAGGRGLKTSALPCLAPLEPITTRLALVSDATGWYGMQGRGLTRVPSGPLLRRRRELCHARHARPQA